MKKRILFVLFGLLVLSRPGFGQASITSATAVVDNLTASTGSAAPTNWTVQGTGSGGTTWRGTAQTTGTSGGWYGNGNISFLGSGTASAGNATWLLRNNSGSSITGFTLSYTARLWKSGSASPTVSVTWSNSASSTNPAQGALANSLSSLSFNDATTNVSTGAAMTQTVTGLTIASGDYIFVRFIHPGGSSSDNLGWDDVSFTATLNSGASAPTVTTSAATSVTNTGAQLNGSVTANNASTTVTFEYGTTVSYGSSVAATQSPVTGGSATAVSASIGSLSANTTYHFRVVGVNTQGTTNGSDQTFTTTDVPAATTSAATSVTNVGAQLNGSVTANNSSTTVTFEYGTTVSYGSSIAATQSPVTGATPTSVSASISGLSQATLYHYRVVAVNSVGTTNGSDQTFTTIAVAPTVTTTTPGTITTTTAASGGNVTSDGGSAVTHKGVVWATSSNPDISLLTLTDDGTGTGTYSSSITGLTPGTLYHVRAYATNAIGTSYGSDVSFTALSTAPATQASGISFSSVTNSSITVTWTSGDGSNRLVLVHSGSAVDSDPVSGTTYTANAGFGNGTQIGTGNYVVYNGTSNTVAVTGLTANTTYYFAIYEFNGSASSENYLTTSPLTGNQTTDGIPVYITHYSPRYGTASDEFIVLFNNSSSNFDLNGYEIAYSSATGSAATAKVSFTTSTIIPSQKYYLMATSASVTVGSISAKAADKTYTAFAADAGQIALRKTSDLSVVFALASGTITSYSFGLSSSAPFTASTAGMTSLDKSDATHYSYTGTLGNDYTYTAAASISDLPNSGDAALPVELSTFTSASAGRNIQLAWQTATEVNAAKFIVERAKASSNAWSAVGDIKAHGVSNAPKNYSFSDKNLVSGTYNYRLKMIDNDGTYEYSQVIEGVVGTPSEFCISQNYPNPFNPSTKISYDLPRESRITLELFSVTGAKVATLQNETKVAGYHDYILNMNTYNLPSGMYLFKISGSETSTGKSFSQVKKLVYLK